MRAPTLIVLLTVHAAVVLGGVYFMLTEFGDQLDSELESQVQQVEQGLEEDFKRIREQITMELERRLPDALE